jgi:hypothetical protein
MAVVFARLRCGRAADERDELAPSHELALDEAHNLALHRTTWAPVHCGEILLLMPVRPDRDGYHKSTDFAGAVGCEPAFL